MWSLADASPERLHSLAREINENGQWKSFLTPQEHQLFAVALEHPNRDTWGRFLQGKIPLRLQIAGADGEGAATDMDAVALAFRVRYMLWESIIDRADTTVWNDLDEPETTPLASNDLSSKVNRIDDNDDYDDNYDDEEEENGNAVEVSPLETIVVETKQEDSEPDAKGRNLAVQNSARMYDTFEEDLESLKRFQRLRESDEEIQRDDPEFIGVDGSANMMNGSGTSSSSSSVRNVGGPPTYGVNQSLRGLAKTAQFGSANLCLKHLLTTIEQKRQSLNVTDLELRNLISDVRKNRSKWASEEKVGQEELYEACERVVLDLRNTTESSTPFLNKVSKREAPNYYDIIKEPMDLNTVMRKLRAFQYGSKNEFVSDLNLIWSNCLTYNSDPAHFLRKHAISMRNKTQALAPLIPDITVRSRAEVEAEAEILERRHREQKRKRESDVEGDNKRITKAPAETEAEQKPEAEAEEPPEGGQQNADSSEKAPDLNGDKAENKPVTNDDGAHTDSVGSVLKEIDGSIVPPHEATTPSVAVPEENGEKIDQSKDQNAKATSPKESPHDSPESLEAASQSLVLKEDSPVPDVESAVWTSATRQQRIECIMARQALFVENKLQMEAPASTRSAAKMLRFERIIKGEDSGNASGNLGIPPPLASGMSLLSADGGEDPFMLEYEVNSGMPGELLNDTSEWISAPVPRIQDLPPSRYLARGELNALINRNLNEMQLIRRIISKILYIRDLQSGQIPQDMYGMGPSYGVTSVAGNVAAPSGVPPSSFTSGSGTVGASTISSVAQSAAGFAPTGSMPGTAGASVSTSLNGSSSGTMGFANPVNSAVFHSIADPEEDISSRLPGAVPIDARAANKTMHRAVAKVIMQAGFESANPRALDCITAIAGDYLSKLGATLVANLEAPDSTASFSSIVTGSLQEMGVAKLGQLTKYISDDILRQGRRLATFRSRLNNMLVDILRPEVERYQDEQFQENSDQFVFGQFSNDLGDDYFGFRDLGLDKELNIASIAVPFHLLQQRVAGQGLGVAGGASHAKRGHEFPEYEPLTPEKIAAMPVLFRGAFERLAAKPLGLPYTAALNDLALSEATHEGLEDAHAEVIVQMSELSGKKQPESRQAKDVAKQLAQKQSQGSTSEEIAAEKGQIEREFLAKMAIQAAVARQKLPANGKLVTRKKRFDHAYVLVKTEKKAKVVDQPKTEDENKESEDEISDNMINFGLNGENDPDTGRTNDDENDMDVEPEEENDVDDDIVSLAFDDDPTATNGFSFDDSLPTGSLMIQGNDDDDDEDVGDTNDDLGFEFMNK